MRDRTKNWSIRIAFIGMVSLNIYGIIQSFDNPAYLFLISLMVISFVFGYTERQIELVGKVMEFSYEDITEDDEEEEDYQPSFLDK